MRKVGQVDSLVKLINSAELKIKTDTINQDLPAIGLSMQTRLTVASDGTELKKYVNNVHGTTIENGKIKQMVSTNTFYFDHNTLIKVEESATKDDKKLEALWYYANDKPIYYTLKSDEAQSRAELLLTMSKAILAKIKL